MSGRTRERLVLLHTERDLIVIDKPAGLLTMPSAPGRAELFVIFNESSGAFHSTSPISNFEYESP